MIKRSANAHLSKKEIIKRGSIYTSSHLVELVYSLVSKYIDSETVIADLGSGYGAFIEKFKSFGRKIFGTEADILSYQLLINEYPDVEFFYENSLCNVSREKYTINHNDKLIIVGNPPYNDTTSIFKKGEKGLIVCDEDLTSRDFGISFLKAYNKLNADFVCVLHPLAYLIKKQNFNSLGAFKENYKLIDAVIFSSKEFESIKKSNSEFPVVAALYKKETSGMDFSYVQKFEFNIYLSQSKFVLSDVLTIDGVVNKYPKKEKTLIDQENRTAPQSLKLQFYTLRDMNALYRNTGFLEGPIANGIDVSLENLYQYAWLFFLKSNFNPTKNKFLYGNLSPLYTNKLNDICFRNQVVSYAYNSCNFIKKYFSHEKITALYGPLTDQYNAVFNELEILSNIFI